MKLIAYIALLLLFVAGCGDLPEAGSVFDDHTASVFNDGAGLADVMDGKNFFFGNLHSHTSYSDGEGTPGETFAWARDTAGYDFYAVTDHAEQLTEAEWLDTGTQADAYNEEVPRPPVPPPAPPPAPPPPCPRLRLRAAPVGPPTPCSDASFRKQPTAEHRPGRCPANASFVGI